MLSATHEVLVNVGFLQVIVVYEYVRAVLVHDYEPVVLELVEELQSSGVAPVGVLDLTRTYTVCTKVTLALD